MLARAMFSHYLRSEDARLSTHEHTGRLDLRDSGCADGYQERERRWNSES